MPRTREPHAAARRHSAIRGTVVLNVLGQGGEGEEESQNGPGPGPGFSGFHLPLTGTGTGTREMVPSYAW